MLVSISYSLYDALKSNLLINKVIDTLRLQRTTTRGGWVGRRPNVCRRKNRTQAKPRFIHSNERTNPVAHKPHGFVALAECWCEVLYIREPRQGRQCLHDGAPLQTPNLRSPQWPVMIPTACLRLLLLSRIKSEAINPDGLERTRLLIR